MPASRKVTSSIHVRVFGSLTVYKDLNVTMPYKALNGHEDTNRYKMSDLLLKFVGQGYKEQLNTSYLEWRDEWMDGQTTVAKVVDKWLLPSCPVDWAWLADVGLCCTQLLQLPFFHLPTKPNLQCHWGGWSLRDAAPISSCSCDSQLDHWRKNESKLHSPLPFSTVGT